VAPAFRAVIFDLGGVVLDSPLHAIARYEAEIGIPAGHVNRVVVARGPEGAWSRLERGEVGMAEFGPAFERECREAGHAISAGDMMARIAAATAPRPAMLAAIRALRARGLSVAALTNNWAAPREERDPRQDELRAEFDAFLESSVLGMRKPDPRIYLHACAALGVEPPEAIFLDDIGSNLKAARALGMTTIKVVEPGAALGELATHLDWPAEAFRA
jgi:putative hydrolase of the HAD superfamily